jgi:hypothetical protein
LPLTTTLKKRKQMKKFLLTMIAAFIGFTAFGQSHKRKVDLKATIVSPANAAQIYADGAYNLALQFDNNGPDTFRKGDTVHVKIKVDTVTLFTFKIYAGSDQAQGGAPLFWNPYNITLKSTSGLSYGAHVLCAVVDTIIAPKNTDTITDPTHANNQQCNTFTFKPNGVEEFSSPNALQVYPNPAISSTTFSYSTSSAQHVRLGIYDVTGKEVAVPINENQGQGDHTFLFDTQKLNPGIYIYRLNVGSDVTNGKLVIGQ